MFLQSWWKRAFLPVVAAAVVLAGTPYAFASGGGGGGGGGGTTTAPSVPPIQLSPGSTTLTAGVTAVTQVLITPSAPAGGAVLSITASNGSVVVPSTLSVGAGLANAQFPMTGAAVTAPTGLTVTVRLGTASSSFGLTILPAAVPTITSVAAFPPVVAGQDVVQVTPGLSSTVPPGGETVSFTSGNPSLLPLPASVLLPPGFVSTPTVTTTAGSVTVPTTVPFTATMNGTTVSGSVQIQPARVPTSLAFSATTVNDSSSLGVGVAISVPADSADNPAFSVALSSSNPAVLSVPLAVGFLSQDSGTSFNPTVGKVSTPTPVTITATANGVSVSGVVTVIPTPPPPFALQSVGVAPHQVAGAGVATGTVTSNVPAPAGGVTVKLSSSDTKLATVPATVLIPAGATSATFPVRTTSQSGASTLSIGAVFQNIGPATTFGVTSTKGGTLLTTELTNQVFAPKTVNDTSDPNELGFYGGGQVSVESGQLPPGMSLLSNIRPGEFFISGPPTKAGTYTFVLKFTGGNNAPAGDGAAYVWVITP
jgi:hypothetical protein